MLKIPAFLYLIAIFAILLCACGSGEVQIVEVTSTPEPTPVVVVATPTPNLEATVSAMVAAQPTAAPDPTDTPRPTYTLILPTTTPDIAATIVADIIQTTTAPTPAPLYQSISDMVQSIEGGLVQILTPTGSGSGFVVSEDGLIVTNAHVVEQHSSVTVRFVDGASLTGQVLGRNETVDLSVVKVNAGFPLQPMEMDNSGSARVGDEAIAMGFPLGDELGQNYTVTSGIVSSRRTYGSVEYIQTDAAVNPGNSGGPLVNRNGQVIGINTSSYSGTHDNISFAISVSVVRENFDSLVSGVNVIADVDGERQTYKNDDCQYSLSVHPNWMMSGEDGCNAYFERYDGGDLVGSIDIWVYDLEADETLLEFAEWWRDELVQVARDWDIFDLIASRPNNDGYDGYVVDYLSSETDEHCISSDVALIVLSSHYHSALVFNAGICAFMPQSVFDEIGEMEFRY